MVEAGKPLKYRCISKTSEQEQMLNSRRALLLSFLRFLLSTSQ